jgi:predicted lipoprotein with Yx(FWY)xxD motif
MTPGRRTSFLARAVVVPLAALALVSGCGSSSGGNSATTPQPARTSGGRPATVGVGETDVGKILVDSRGRTLYLFEKDSGPQSTCTSSCATAWPPLRVGGTPVAGTGATASLLSTATRSDGPPQVTYDGHPLYRFGGDRKAGDTNGQGVSAFGAGWFTVTAAGAKVAGQPSRPGKPSGY